MYSIPFYEYSINIDGYDIRVMLDQTNNYKEERGRWKEGTRWEEGGKISNVVVLLQEGRPFPRPKSRLSSNTRK